MSAIGSTTSGYGVKAPHSSNGIRGFFFAWRAVRSRSSGFFSSTSQLPESAILNRDKGKIISAIGKGAWGAGIRNRNLAYPVRLHC